MAERSSSPEAAANLSNSTEDVKIGSNKWHMCKSAAEWKQLTADKTPVRGSLTPCTFKKMYPEEIKEVGMGLLEEARRAYKNASPELVGNQNSWEKLGMENYFEMFYTYFLLDSRKLNKKPITIYDFADAVFYVGKGLGLRLENHLDETNKFLENQKNKKGKTMTAKHQTMMDVWRDQGHIIQLKMKCMSSEEAETREAFLIETIGLNNLTNMKQGTNHIPEKPEEKKIILEIGAALLQEAMTVFVEKRCHYVSMSRYYWPNFNHRLPTRNINNDESCNDMWAIFKVYMKEHCKKNFDGYPKGTKKDYFSSICVMLDPQKPTATSDVAAFADALIYLSLENKDQNIIKGRHRKVREMYEKSVQLRQCPVKFSFAQGLYLESLYAYILGKEKTNKLLIDIMKFKNQYKTILTEERLGKASIGCLEWTRKLLIEKGTDVSLE